MQVTEPVTALLEVCSDKQQLQAMQNLCHCVKGEQEFSVKSQLGKLFTRRCSSHRNNALCTEEWKTNSLVKIRVWSVLLSLSAITQIIMLSLIKDVIQFWAECPLVIYAWLFGKIKPFYSERRLYAFSFMSKETKENLLTLISVLWVPALQQDLTFHFLKISGPLCTKHNGYHGLAQNKTSKQTLVRAALSLECFFEI